MLFDKVVSFNQHIRIFMHNQKLYMPVSWKYIQWFLFASVICADINIFFSNFLSTPGLASTDVNLLTNLQIILKIDVLATKTEDHQLIKNGASNGFNLLVKAVVLLTFIEYINKFIHS